MTSISFITGTGFIKCIPITCDGRLVAPANCVIEIEEVLLAIIADFLSILSVALRTDFFTFAFYTIAYTTKSISYYPNFCIWFANLNLDKNYYAYSSVNLFLDCYFFIQFLTNSSDFLNAI